ncbi:hypothetical protein ZWY2020_009091 [Hordeum vulgare]|nr:hypothetical protein ZWY2020_009091 [Hordeum vulgare]
MPEGSSLRGPRALIRAAVCWPVGLLSRQASGSQRFGPENPKAPGLSQTSVRSRDLRPPLQLLKEMATLRGHQDYSFSSAWHPGGHVLATGTSRTRQCWLWDTRNLGTRSRCWEEDETQCRASGSRRTGGSGCGRASGLQITCTTRGPAAAPRREIQPVQGDAGVAFSGTRTRCSSGSPTGPTATACSKFSRQGPATAYLDSYM